MCEKLIVYLQNHPILLQFRARLPESLSRLAEPFSVKPNRVRAETLKQIKRVVIKLGTGVLTNSQKQPDLQQMRQLVGQFAGLRKAGLEIVMVTSGAVGSGMGALGFQQRPTRLPALQACAAVGQCRLMATYEKLFARYKIAVGQVLLTHEDLEDHERHFNARATLLQLLEQGAIPIVNENDAVSTTELKFGDNDKLSALVATLLSADLLVILTTVDGVIDHFGEPDARRIPIIDNITSNVEGLAGGTTSATAVGGMKTKIQAARIVVRAGIPLVIAPGRNRRVLKDILAGEDEGTLFLPDKRQLTSRQRWIAFHNRPQGRLWVDEGARKALIEKPVSLLLPGIRRCDGTFGKGAVVSICDTKGKEFARGITRHPSDTLEHRKSSPSESPIVIHRDHLVVL